MRVSPGMPDASALKLARIFPFVSRRTNRSAFNLLGYRLREQGPSSPGRPARTSGWPRRSSVVDSRAPTGRGVVAARSAPPCGALPSATCHRRRRHLVGEHIPAYSVLSVESPCHFYRAGVWAWATPEREHSNRPRSVAQVERVVGVAAC